MKKIKLISKVKNLILLLGLVVVAISVFGFLFVTNNTSTAMAGKNTSNASNNQTTSKNFINEEPYYLVGTFTNWEIIKDEAHTLKYDNDKDYFYGNINYQEGGTCEWKIVQGDNWSGSWGGTIKYVTDEDKKITHGQCVGLVGNKNLNPPKSGKCSFQVYFQIINTNNTIIAVNQEPKFDVNPQVTINLWDSARGKGGHVASGDYSKLEAKGWKHSYGNEELWRKVLDIENPQTERQLLEEWEGITINPEDSETVFTGFKPDAKDENVVLSLEFHAKYEYIYQPGMNLEIFGEFNNWGNPWEKGGEIPKGVPMQYDNNRKWYFAELKSEGAEHPFTGQFKIRKPDDSLFNRGGDALFVDENSLIASAVPYGNNYTFPEGTLNHKVYLTTKNGQIDKLYVNILPDTKTKSVSLKTDNNCNTVHYFLDNNNPIETSETTLHFPIEDCAQIIADHNKVIDGINTISLKTFDAAGNQKHECYFKYNEQGNLSVLPKNRFRYQTQLNGDVESFTFWMSQLPKNVQINTNYGRQFQYATSNQNLQWNAAASTIFDTSQNNCPLEILDDTQNGTINIYDNEKKVVSLKEAVDCPKINSSNLTYDQINGFVFIDYPKMDPTVNPGHDTDVIVTANTGDCNLWFAFISLIILISSFAILLFSFSKTKISN